MRYTPLDKGKRRRLFMVFAPLALLLSSLQYVYEPSLLTLGQLLGSLAIVVMIYLYFRSSLP